MYAKKQQRVKNSGSSRMAAAEVRDATGMFTKMRLLNHREDMTLQKEISAIELMRRHSLKQMNASITRHKLSAKRMNFQLVSNPHMAYTDISYETGDLSMPPKYGVSFCRCSLCIKRPSTSATIAAHHVRRDHRSDLTLRRSKTQIQATLTHPQLRVTKSAPARTHQQNHHNLSVPSTAQPRSEITTGLLMLPDLPSRSPSLSGSSLTSRFGSRSPEALSSRCSSAESVQIVPTTSNEPTVVTTDAEEQPHDGTTTRSRVAEFVRLRRSKINSNRINLKY